MSHRRPLPQLLGIRHSWPLASTAGRIRILLLLFAVVFTAAGLRALQFQVVDAGAKAQEAMANLSLERTIAPLRGQILDRNGDVLAFTQATVLLSAHPNLIAGKGGDVTKASEADRAKGATIPGLIAPVIARCAGLDAADVQAKLTAKNADGSYKSYVRLARQQSIDVYNCIQNDPVVTNRAMPLAWVVEKESDPTRVYPMKSVASSVLGYLSDGKGVAGLEASQNDILTGTAGSETYENSRNGKIPLGNNTITPAVNGSTVTTTIDAPLCYQTQQLVDQRRQEMKQDWAFAVVMEVKTGNVLCLANTPTFDGNQVGSASPESLGNPAMFAPYEPGSTVKMLTLAAILDAGGATPDTITHVAATQDGITSGEHTIRDSEKHPAIDYTTRGILVNSSNQGVIQLMRSTFKDKGTAGKQAYVDYLQSFGLGQKTNVGIPGENPGVLPAEKILSDSYTIDSVAFGTSLSVNAIQMAAAVNAVANGGVYVAPSLIASTTSADGKITPAPAPATHRVIKASTSQQMLGMMENRVLDSFPVIGIPGVRTAGKTGTAWQGPNMISSIMGVAPADDPQILVYSVFYQKGSHSGAGITMAGPVYQDIMSLALQRYGVLPSADFEAHCVEQPLDSSGKTKKAC